MARMSTNPTEHLHVATISQQVPIGGIPRVTLISGVALEGVLRSNSCGNNGGQGGWQYYGELELQTKDGRRHLIDYLDIQSVTNVWTTTLGEEYERLGLIQIQK